MRQGNQALLQLTGDTFGVAGQLHVALCMGGPSLNGASRLDRAFPIGDLRTAGGGEFLLGHERDKFERELLRGNGQVPTLRISPMAGLTGPVTRRLQGELTDRKMVPTSVSVNEGAA